MAGTVNRSGGDRKSMGPDEFPHDGLPQKPSGLGRSEAIVWKTLMGQIPHELLRAIDSYQLSVLCSLICRERVLAKICRDDPSDHQSGRAYMQTTQQIGRLSVAFGLSPIDRRRIRLEPNEQEESVFNSLLARMSGAN
jgi:hypothetical protein